jgi:hypothetical protein
MGHGTWDMGHGTWDMGHGTWDMGHGTWDMGHGPSKVCATSGANLARPLFWSDRSVCDQRSKLRLALGCWHK